MTASLPRTLDVRGDGTYLALVDTHRYSSFVGPDWASEPRLLEPHWVREMAGRALLVWETGQEADWRVRVQMGLSAQAGARDVRGAIEVTAGEVYLANYDSLTMAAQFRDHTLPDDDCRPCRIEIPSGTYTVRIVQLTGSRGDTAEEAG